MAVQLRDHGLVQVSKSLRDRVGISRFHDLGTHQSHLKAPDNSVSWKVSSVVSTLQNTQAEHSKISANPTEIGRMSQNRNVRDYHCNLAVTFVRLRQLGLTGAPQECPPEFCGVRFALRIGFLSVHPPKPVLDFLEAWRVAFSPRV
jgi:hypothetical protein